MIFMNIIKDTPFPIPLTVICSPNHIKNVAAVVNVSIIKNIPNFEVSLRAPCYL